MSPSMHGCFECSQTSAWDGCAKHRTMTPDRPTGPATYTAEGAVKYAYSQGRDDERARILAALPEALQAPHPVSGVSLYDLWSTEQYSFESPQEVAAALAAAIERVLNR